MQEEKKKKVVQQQKVTYRDVTGKEYSLDLQEGAALSPMRQKLFSGLKIWHNTIPGFDASKFPPLIIAKIPKNNGINVGHGVFAKTKIKKGDSVFLYTGEILDPKNLTDAQRKSPYLFTISKVLNGALTGAVDAQEVGGVARFANHLPTQAELEQFYTFKDEFDIGQVATANVKSIGQFDENGQPVIGIFTALRDIAPGEQLGFSYGLMYHKPLGRAQDEIFNMQGEIIDRSAYTFKERVLWIRYLGFNAHAQRMFSRFLWHVMKTISVAVKETTDTLMEEWIAVYTLLTKKGIDAAEEVLHLLKNIYGQVGEKTLSLRRDGGGSEGVLVFDIEALCASLTAQLENNLQHLHVDAHFIPAPEFAEKYRAVQKEEDRLPLPSAAVLGRSMAGVLHPESPVNTPAPSLESVPAEEKSLVAGR